MGRGSGPYGLILPLANTSSSGGWAGVAPSASHKAAVQHPAHPGRTWSASDSIQVTEPTVFEKVKVVERGILEVGGQQQKEQWTL